MFKTSFSKYITAFIIIIFISFTASFGIITFVVRSYASNETKEKLEQAGTTIVSVIAQYELNDIEDQADYASKIVSSVINLDRQIDVIIAKPNGEIALSTLTSQTLESGVELPTVDLSGSLGRIDIKSFSSNVDEQGYTYYVHKGDLNGILGEQSLVYAREIKIDGEIGGYVLTLASTVKQDAIVEITRKAIIYSSLGVMIAAVIATYIITERMVKPLKNMTNAAKKFAKGDFSTRVYVEDTKDEVSELGVAFNNMADSLENLEKMRNSFLANISHDLRTPMTTIAGFIDGINSGAIPPEKHEYYLGVISAEVHRLSRLVSQLLDVSRLESGERKFNFTDFDIAEVARLILISFEKKIEDKKLEVEFDAEFDEMYAHADKDAIYQVLYNLCHNAIKFAREGGIFRISISRATDTKLKISIYDQGQSISEEDSKQIFDRFYKTDKSRGLDKSGVGLGLYISKTIIDAHGETIGVESVENESCEFWFTVTEGSQPQKRKMMLDKP